ncbi:MAG: AI-2E family transporter [Opitutae bacterium]|nr:AI-2E family transporter [Opitutae bacterium]
MLGNSFGSHVHDVYTQLDAGTLEIEPPSESVAEWPVVGERVHTAWNNMATDLPEALKRNEMQVKALSKKLLGAALNGAKAMMLLFGAFVIAGVMMAFGQSGIQALRRVFTRFVGEAGGVKLQALCTGTVRSVAVGVLGVALIQAILFGLGFMLIGLKTAGVLALITLFIGIIQVPALIVAIPVIAYIWMGGDGSTAMNVIFTIYFIIAALSDNVLKPMLLGRGVDAPMPIILIGALGGMVSAGFIGLFIGAVVLALGYKVFMNWVGEAPASVQQ